MTHAWTGNGSNVSYSGCISGTELMVARFRRSTRGNIDSGTSSKLLLDLLPCAAWVGSPLSDADGVHLWVGYRYSAQSTRTCTCEYTGGDVTVRSWRESSRSRFRAACCMFGARDQDRRSWSSTVALDSRSTPRHSSANSKTASLSTAISSADSLRRLRLDRSTSRPTLPMPRLFWTVSELSAPTSSGTPGVVIWPCTLQPTTPIGYSDLWASIRSEQSRTAARPTLGGSWRSGFLTKEPQGRSNLIGERSLERARQKTP